MSKPKLIITNDTLRNAVEYEAWLGTRNTLCSRGDPSKVSGTKHHSVLYDLPYFEVQIAIHIFAKVEQLFLLCNSKRSFKVIWQFPFMDIGYTIIVAINFLGSIITNKFQKVEINSFESKN